MTNAFTRRRFLSTVAATTVAAPLAITGRNFARPPAGDRITLGFIGVGTMGRGHLGGFLGQKDVQVVAVCDVVAERREDAKRIVESHYDRQKDKGEYKGCTTYGDFRHLLARKDLDAVVIATPDHWHTIPCLAAAKAGLDIYCEKPLTHHIAEGRMIADAVKKYDIIFQTGSQQRSEFGNHFRKAVELVRNGRIGRLKTIRIGVGGPAVPCDLPE
jgi:predicted dehydrogenase